MEDKKSAGGNGKASAFVERRLQQDSAKTEARFTIIVHNAPSDCGIQLTIEDSFKKKLGISIPSGFFEVQPTLIRIVPSTERIFGCSHILKSGVPFEIVFPIRNLAAGFGQVMIALPFKLAPGGGCLNANVSLGLGDPEGLEKMFANWKLSLRNPSR